jgi:hypothetical protein
MRKGTKLYELGKQAERLFAYLERADVPEAIRRDTVMHLVHELNAAYTEWGFELDTAYLRAPREEKLDSTEALE